MMERLTQNFLGKYLLPTIPMEINSKEELDKFHEARRFYENCVIRLGEYEDTGLSPERCAELAKEVKTLDAALDKYWRAEEEGRLVVISELRTSGSLTRKEYYETFVKLIPEFEGGLNLLAYEKSTIRKALGALKEWAKIDQEAEKALESEGE